jgi:hypothetical protein
VRVLRPLLLAIGAVAGAAYRVFFAKSDLRMAIRLERKLASDVAKLFSFLFTERGGVLVGRDLTLRFPPPFDYATTVATDRKLEFRFTRGRDEEHVDIRPAPSVGRWHELSLVLSLLDPSEQVRRGSIQDFRQAAGLLRLHLRRVDEAFCSSGSQDFMRALDEEHERDRVIAKQIETEINRRLYES